MNCIYCGALLDGSGKCVSHECAAKIWAVYWDKAYGKKLTWHEAQKLADEVRASGHTPIIREDRD